jgi:hypothetical protein
MGGTDAEKPKRGLSRQLLIQVYLELVVAVIAGAGALLLIRLTLTEAGLIVMAGSAGVAGAELSPLLRSIPSGDQDGARPWYFAMLCAVAGFGITAGIYVLVRALLFSGGAVLDINKSGVLAFGGIVGAIVGRVVVGLPVFAGYSATSSESLVATALADLERRFSGGESDNYDGYVRAFWIPQREPGRLVGTIRVQLVPSVLYDADIPRERSPNNSLERVARLHVEGGRQSETAQFVVSVVASAFDVYPNRVQLEARLDTPSELLEFSVLGSDIIPDASEATSEPSMDEREAVAALIDISQRGRTVQLLELTADEEN